MSNYQERALKTKNYNLLALAVTCSWCGARKGEPCRRSPFVVTNVQTSVQWDRSHIKGTHYSRRALAAEARRKAAT
jgi:hypothetical protein